ENDNLYEKFRERQGTLINGVVYRFDYGDVIIDLGDAEARMPYRERLQNERYRQGDRIRAYILEVADSGSKVKIIVSRTHPEFVRQLLELEVPEIAQNIIEIKAIAREPGDRTKIAVYSNKENVDCVGACVGIKGTRIKAVIEELAGERIDVIEWDKDLKSFIRKALAPAEIKSVELNEANNAATILVKPDQLAIAIGKKGQNVKLTSRLVDCRIDIVADEKKDEREKINIPGIGKGIIGILETHGYDTMSKLSKISVKDLLKLPGIGIKTAAKIKMLK
ncbi:transcription termination factor NusA, partial [bacterium]|nr:transcription termination factor NusA [bacterium]